MDTTRTDGTDWPTLAVAAAIAAGFAAVLAWHERVPLMATIVALAVLAGWYNSLQHEVIHGHPTPWRWVNTAIAIVPLGLVVRFADYRRSHLAHHRAPEITAPGRDPESFYVSAEAWARFGPGRRTTSIVLSTLAGRLVIGPFVFAARHWSHGFGPAGWAARIGRGVAHGAGVAVVIAIVIACGLPVWAYVVGVAWGGGALSLLRSFAEHRRVDAGSRSAVVRSGWFFSLLYLNNNLHHTHHAQPWVSWFRLPGAHVAIGGDQRAAEGAGLYRGYGEIFRRFLVVPFDRPVAAEPSANVLAHDPDPALRVAALVPIELTVPMGLSAVIEPSP